MKPKALKIPKRENHLTKFMIINLYLTFERYAKFTL